MRFHLRLCQSTTDTRTAARRAAGHLVRVTRHTGCDEAGLGGGNHAGTGA